MREGTMRPAADLRKEDAPIRFVLTDIDDTLTNGGRLRASAYEALWDLYDHGFHVIPVTGRPAGWCDLIIRLWPVQAVVGENGAFVYYRETEEGTDRIRTMYHPEISADNPQERLSALRERVLTELPEVRIARDQPGRQFDLAIDFREDPPYLGFDVAESIKRLCEAEGAVAKISSIHVNAWYGSYDKLSMARMFMERQFGLSDEKVKEQVLFCGDSPNDQPMFSFFPHSCGVANIRDMLDHITSPPAYVTQKRGGEGFVELTEILLKR